MLTITLPDASQKQFAGPVSAQEVAAAIGPGLAKSALAAKVNDQWVDLSHVISTDSRIQIITEKDPSGLEIIRHSTAHLLAHAVKLLYPSAQVTIGPVVENGFYYDFAFERSFTPEDLQAIEKKMEEIAQQDFPIQRRVMPRDDAVNFFRGIGEEYKAQIIAAIPTEEAISLYQQGEFIDLCRGPHVPSTGRLKAFKLMKVAGAYWRGDSRNAMLQRIYGTAWADKKTLKDYLFQLEEAEKRDHRKLAKQLDLFHIQEEAPGMIFWHPHGWTIYQQIVAYIRELLRLNGYQEICTPQLVDRVLWEKSGHWEKFRENMFTTHSENRDYAIKPMNCPCHIQVFNQGIKSYRDLPIRLAEFGSCHRNEASGTLHGVMRLRNFVQDDAHIFCTPEQVQTEVSNFMDLLFEVYGDFGFKDILVKLSTRPNKRVGDDAVWDKAEQALEQAITSKGLKWQLQPGEGAFYGPKIEFSLKDSLGREWQCGTIQLDFSMPGLLGASYVDDQGGKQVPVMLHRAILGSIERFVGILIEETAGHFPPWLAPVQVVVANITDKQGEYVEKIHVLLKKHGFRSKSDLRNEKIGFKIREHTLMRVPYILVAGDREMATQTIAVRLRNGQDLGCMGLETFMERLREDIARRSQHQ